MGKAINAFLLLLLLSPAVYAQTSHTVGESSGWNTGVNYGNWAKGKTFSVGDSLVFNYDFTHAVDEVSQDDYNSCSSANSISSDSNSPTTITLSSASTRYFICPNSNHCSQGMKLAVTVAASTPGGSPPSPSSGGSPPSPPGKTTPSTPSTPQGNAAAAPGGGKSLMVGFSVALGAMLGLLG